MKQDIQRIMLAAAKPLFLIFILYMLKIVEVGMHWDLSHLGIYPMEKRGVFGNSDSSVDTQWIQSFTG